MVLGNKENLFGVNLTLSINKSILCFNSFIAWFTIRHKDIHAYTYKKTTIIIFKKLHSLMQPWDHLVRSVLGEYWSGSVSRSLWTEPKARSINLQNKNETNISQNEPNKLVQ